MPNENPPAQPEPPGYGEQPQPQPPEQPPYGYGAPPAEPGCDPAVIDDLKCKARGIAEQAAYNATYQDLIEKAKTDYDTARKDYRTKRNDAALKVQDMRHQIKHLIERIRHMIEQDRVVRCLDQAFGEIVDDLNSCDGKTGCCAPADCDFPTDTAGMAYEDLVALIATYQRRANESKDCFTVLIAEPAALEKRVGEYKIEIDNINTALNADPATTDLKRVYASALVAARHVDLVWNGFEEVNDFVDCLCSALKCWTKGSVAVSILTGAKAIEDCKRESKQAHCTDLQTNTVDEILAMYDKICPPQSAPEDQGYGYGEPAGGVYGEPPGGGYGEPPGGGYGEPPGGGYGQPPPQDGGHYRQPPPGDGGYQQPPPGDGGYRQPPPQGGGDYRQPPPGDGG